MKTLVAMMVLIGAMQAQASGWFKLSGNWKLDGQSSPQAVCREKNLSVSRAGEKSVSFLFSSSSDFSTFDYKGATIFSNHPRGVVQSFDPSGSDRLIVWIFEEGSASFPNGFACSYKR